MSKNEIATGVVHKIPKDLKNILISNKALLDAWEDITPLARNEWLCWIESAKKEETRSRRIERMNQDLRKRKHRPCCWAGCIHR